MVDIASQYWIIPFGTVDDVLRDLQPEELEMLKMHLASGLIEQKIFREFRL